ncbi:hypothetical protein O177_02940 [Chlamydia trachomatis]|nr:hypothetical protein O177_02940 [Chlamydia trachomatis]AKR33070.1 hypothetical protein DCS63711_02955 [Chlamydia trachomatis D/CS637/11]
MYDTSLNTKGAPLLAYIQDERKRIPLEVT